eukprot:TRINITY_DN5062_c0_g2_i1.p1 TRINITY_DN5062_c0_g2~~TRINITY_DN5062_c0_g2_i1.p1  ORF type:complete len:1040 (+),score=174.13 TRINITY_DN5062_c0_g2_i1:25-3120(+)
MATLLKPDEVERIRDWASGEYKKKCKARGEVWDGRITLSQLLEQLRIVITSREQKKERGKVSKLNDDEIARRMKSIEADLLKVPNDTKHTQNTEKKLVLEDVLRYYSTDPQTRFDIQYVKERQLEAEDALGLWMYLPFIVLFSFFLIEGRGLGNGYWMNAGLLDKFLDEEFSQSNDLRYKKVYADIASEDELWEFLEGPLLESLWINDDGLPDNQVKANQFVQTSNMPIGAMKIRQLRVDEDGCGTSWSNLMRHEVSQLSTEKVISRLNDFNTFCYPEYSLQASYDKTNSYETVDVIHDGSQLQNERHRCDQDPSCTQTPFPVTYSYKVPFVPANVHPDDMISVEAFQYRSCKHLNGSSVSIYSGKANYYDCDGYAQIIPFSWDLEKVKQSIGVLKDGIRTVHYNNLSHANETARVKWIDKQTRGITFELFLYNQNIELISRYLFFVELTAGGAWIPLHETTSFKLFSWDSHDWVYFLFFFLYFMWVMGYVGSWFRFVANSTATTREQMLQSNNNTCRLWFKAWWHAVSDFWIWFDFVNLTLLVAAWGIRFELIDIGLSKNNLLQNLYYPPDYEKIGYLGVIATNLNAISAMFVYLRSFYFLKLNPRLNLLTRTIGVARDEILAILLIFMFVFIAFALMCYVVYGHVDENYRTLGQSTISLMLMLLGDFDYIALREAQRIFTPIFFALFQVLTVFLLFNMVVAVLSDAFNEVQENKYHDRKLVQALVEAQEKSWSASDPPKYIGTSWEIPHILMRNSLVVEVVYWWKLIIVMGKKLTGRLTPAEYIHEKQLVHNTNPRIYWAKLERNYYESKKSTNFVDNLQLTPKVLDDYLEEVLGRDKEYFLYDQESGEEGMILQSAKDTHVAPQELVGEMMEFHHEWYKEVSQKTTTGNAEDRKAMREQRHADRLPNRKDEIDELFDTKFANCPQRRWEEQRARIDILRSQLKKISDPANGTRDKCVPCGTKKSEAVSTLESRITAEVELHMDDLICGKINEIIDKIMTHDMPTWISNLVASSNEGDGKSGNGRSMGH